MPSIAKPISILITGATGMLGTALLDAWNGAMSLWATASSLPDAPLPGNPEFFAFSFEEESFAPLAGFCTPDVVINCSAVTDHTWCEKYPERTRAINALAPQKLAITFPSAYIIHISTDAVFGPEAVFPTESAPAHPQDVYGKTKREAEQLLVATHPAALSLRTTIVGLGGRRRTHSFAAWVLQSLQESKPIGLFTDAIFTPVTVWDFALLLEWCIAERPQGILHAGCPEPISKHDFGLQLAKACGLDTSLITPKKLADVSASAGKRLDQSLDSRRLESLRKKPLPNASQCIMGIAKHFLSSNKAEK